MNLDTNTLFFYFLFYLWSNSLLSKYLQILSKVNDEFLNQQRFQTFEINSVIIVTKRVTVDIEMGLRKKFSLVKINNFCAIVMKLCHYYLIG